MGVFSEYYQTVQLGQVWTNKEKTLSYTIYKLRENVLDDYEYDVYTFFHHENDEFCMGGSEKFVCESAFLKKMRKLNLSIAGINQHYIQCQYE